MVLEKMRLLGLLLCLLIAPQSEGLRDETGVMDGRWLKGLMLLVPRGPVPREAVAVGTKTGEALADPLPHLHCPCILFNERCYALDPPGSRDRGRSGLELCGLVEVQSIKRH